VSAPESAGAFTGIPLVALDFYEDLEDDNSRTFWLAHKDTYDSAVRRPMELLTAQLAPEFGAVKLFRPHRDIRFAKDKTPYKTQQGAVLGSAAIGALYVHVGAPGLFVGGGSWSLAADQVHRLRAGVAEDVTGRALERILARLEAAGLTVGGDRLTRLPSGFDRDHPRAELLRHKAITAGREFGAPDWLPTPRTAAEVAAVWRAIAPLNAWLRKHVGASELPKRAR
jgi:uncharacterized protein (TIGR02453 family)